MSRKRATLTDLLNNLTFKTLYNKYKLLATSCFEWEGLPEGIETRHIEKLLFDRGDAVFFRDPRMSFMCLQVSDAGVMNVNGDPVRYLATGFNYTRQLSADKCVIIKNNMLRLNTSDFIMFYVNKLTEAERTMDTNVKVCKTPFIVACDDKNLLTFKQIISQIEENALTVYADKGLNLDALNVLQTKADFLGNELMDYKKSVENELLTFLGFNNMAVDKKERVNVEEATSNNQIIDAFSDLQLKAREKACEEINDMFGLSLSVKRKEVKVNVGNQSLSNNQGNSGTA